MLFVGARSQGLAPSILMDVASLIHRESCPSPPARALRLRMRSLSSHVIQLLEGESFAVANRRKCMAGIRTQRV